MSTEATQAEQAKEQTTEQDVAVEAITAFKGFDQNWQCRGFQFSIGQTYTHEGRVKACESGFHSCEYPLDVFSYYVPADSRYAEVKASGDICKHADDSKIASRTVAISAEIGIPGIVKAAISYVTSRCTPAKAEHATGDRSASSATGDRSASSATGYQSASSATGDRSASEIKPNEDGIPQHAVAIATGIEGRARDPAGSAIVLCYRNDDGEMIHIRASKAGENGIAPDTWYSLNSDGDFVKAEGGAQ
jgi:hypothetical protein